MSMIMFATVCDRCKIRSSECTAHASCTECLEDVCAVCSLPDTYDPETCTVLCRECGGDA